MKLKLYLISTRSLPSYYFQPRKIHFWISVHLSHTSARDVISILLTIQWRSRILYPCRYTTRISKPREGNAQAIFIYQNTRGQINYTLVVILWKKSLFFRRLHALSSFCLPSSEQWDNDIFMSNAFNNEKCVLTVDKCTRSDITKWRKNSNYVLWQFRAYFESYSLFDEFIFTSICFPS